MRFFVPLRIWALADPNIASAAEVGRALRALDRETFWNSDRGRELLWTIRARWSELSEEDRSRLKRGLSRAGANESESDTEFVERRSSVSAAWLIWMRDAGLGLSAATLARLPDLQKANPRWRDDWAKTADQSYESRIAYVKQEIDPTPIADLPLSAVIARCDELAQRDFGSFIDRDPFSGLVQTDPQHAMDVLDFETKRNNYPRRYWSRFFSSWPKTAKTASLVLLAQMIPELPPELLVNVRYELTRGLGQQYAALQQLDCRTAHRCFDHVVNALEAGGEEALNSTQSRDFWRFAMRRVLIDWRFDSPTNGGEHGHGMAIE